MRKTPENSHVWFWQREKKATQELAQLESEVRTAFQPVIDLLEENNLIVTMLQKDHDDGEVARAPLNLGVLYLLIKRINEADAPVVSYCLANTISGKPPLQLPGEEGSSVLKLRNSYKKRAQIISRVSPQLARELSSEASLGIIRRYLRSQSFVIDFFKFREMEWAGQASMMFPQLVLDDDSWD